MSFRDERLFEFSLPAGTVWLMTEVAEAKGRQTLFTQQTPQVFKALQEAAIVQSAESSNRIEGVIVRPERLRPLVIGNAKPRDRSEEEVQGYRRALDLIHNEADNLSISPDMLLELHRLVMAGSGDAGQWKHVENDIIELNPGVAPRVRFRTTPVKETPDAIEELCLLYHHALNQGHLPPLLAIGAFVFDFLCIHPFRDGNGRISRLVTLLLLYHHRYEAGRYISLERLVEESREEYYDALQSSSQDWHEGGHDLLPWLSYFLAVLRRAYREFEARTGDIKAGRGTKRAMVEQVIEATRSEFT